MKNANVIPVNPTISEVLGRKSYPAITDIPERVDVVDIFRKPEDVPPVVSDTLNGKDYITFCGELSILVGDIHLISKI